MGETVVPASGRSGQEIDKIAFELLKLYQPQVLLEPSVVDIEEFFELRLEDHTGIRASYDRLPPGIHGVTDSERMTSIVDVSLLEEERSVLFARSTIAHECGHAIIHVPEFRAKKRLLRSIQDKEDVQLKMYRKADVPVYKNPEWQAHRFAGSFLVPEKTLREAWREQRGDVAKLAKVYNVTLAFMQSRLKAVKLIG